MSETENTQTTDPTTAKADDMLHIRREDLEELLKNAADKGAERCLARLGLENGHAARDVRELRGLLDAWRTARKTAWQTIIRVAITGLLAVILAGAVVKLELLTLFGAK